MDNRYMKTYARPLIIEKWKLKTRGIASHLSKWLASINPQTTTSITEDVEKKEPLCTVAGNVAWFDHCEKQYGVSSKIKNGTAL